MYEDRQEGGNRVFGTEAPVFECNSGVFCKRQGDWFMAMITQNV